MPKLIVLDLDGTLLKSDKTISKETLSVLDACMKKGHKMVIATARPPRVCHDFIPDILKREYVVYYNGAEIYSNYRKIYSKYISEMSAEKIIRFLYNNYPDAITSMEIENKLYSNLPVGDLFGNIEYELVNYKDIKYQPAAKILVDLTKIGDPGHIKAFIPSDCRMVVTDGGILGQIMAEGVSKMEAIKFILNNWSLTMRDVVAFGDDYNDLEIMKESGTGVAMGNAVEELKQAAKYVSKTNDEDGVAYFLNEFLLKL